MEGRDSLVEGCWPVEGRDSRVEGCWPVEGRDSRVEGCWPVEGRDSLLALLSTLFQLSPSRRYTLPSLSVYTLLSRLAGCAEGLAARSADDTRLPVLGS